MCPPRYGTQRDTDRPTLGPDVEAAHFLINRQLFMPHQRYIADVMWELDPDTVQIDGEGRMTGRRWYDTAVLIMPRQNGKTSYVEAHMVAATRRGDRRRGCVYAAQNRQMAGFRLMTEFERLKLGGRGSPFRRHYKPRYSNGSESITWHADHSFIAATSSSKEAGHGLTLDDAVLDEAFAHVDLTAVTALQPTMLTRPDPQLFVVSTLGDGTDGLLMHYQDVGLASLSDPASRVAYFEWSATDDDDRDDPDVWARVMPALGHTIDLERVRSFRKTTKDAEWDRSYLCRRPAEDLTAKLPPDAWADGRRGADHLPGPPFVLAAAVAADRSSTTIAVAGTGSEPGRVAVALDRRPGVTWAGKELAETSRRHSVAHVWADRRGGAGAVIDAAKANGLIVAEMDTADVVSSCGSFYDLVVDRQLEHAAHPDLDLGAARATTRPLGDTWAWCMRTSDVDISPLMAATYAAALHRREFPNGPGDRLIH